MSSLESKPQSLLSRRGRSFLLRLIITFSLLAGFGSVALWRIDIGWNDTWIAIKAINPWWYLIALVTHYLTFVFRGYRWILLLKNSSNDGQNWTPSLWYASRVILMSWFANSVAWFRVGDAYRAYIYSEDSKVSFSTSMGVVLADRIVDLAVIVVLMITGVIILLAVGQIAPPVLILILGLALLVILVIALLAMVFARKWISPKLPRQIRETYHKFYDATMGSFRRMDIVFILAIAAWLCEVGRLFFVLKAMGVSISLGLILFVPMANGLLSGVPLTPGGLGFVETGITGLLGLELAFELAVAVALVDRTISFLSTILFGGMAFLIRQINSLRNVVKEDS